MGPVTTEVSPVPGMQSSRYSDAADIEPIAFEPSVTWTPDSLTSSTAETRDPILANFRVLARTNALLRAVLNDY